MGWDRGIFCSPRQSTRICCCCCYQPCCCTLWKARKQPSHDFIVCSAQGFFFFFYMSQFVHLPFSHKSESSSSEHKSGFGGNPVMSPGPIKRSSVAVCQSNCYRRTDLFHPLDLCFTFCFNSHLYHVNRDKATSIFWLIFCFFPQQCCPLVCLQQQQQQQ